MQLSEYKDIKDTKILSVVMHDQICLSEEQCCCVSMFVNTYGYFSEL